MIKFDKQKLKVGNIEIGQRFTEQKKEKEIKTEYIANFLGVTHTSIFHKQAGRVNWNVCELKQICDAFGFDFLYIITGERKE